MTISDNLYEWLLGLRSYLNSNGYAISHEDVKTFYENLSYDEIEDEDSLIGMLKTVCCNNQKEYLLFDQYYASYRKASSDVCKYRKLLEKQETEFQSKKVKLEKQLAQARELRDKMTPSSPDLKTLKMLSQYDGFGSDDEEFRRAAEQALNDANLFHLYGHCSGIQQLLNRLVDDAEGRFLNNDENGAEFCANLHSSLKRAAKRWQDIPNPDNLQIDIAAQQRNLEVLHASSQRKIQAAIDSALHAVVEKDAAILHRPEFASNGGAVRCSFKGNIGDIGDRPLNALSDADNAILQNYIRDNVQRIKTKMRRHVHEGIENELDVRQTINKSVRNNGVPIELYYRHPTLVKPKIFMLLDVSGSCKEVSSLFLEFMYRFKDVFTGGCYTFAFVNSLIDISQIMEASNAEEAIKQTFATIPTRGVYSNYAVPLEDFWKRYQTKMHDYSIVILIGDMRNNKNPTAEEYLKAIRSRAHKFIMLNTEDVDEWDCADSLASLYAQYGKMYETTTVSELLGVMETL